MHKFFLKHNTLTEKNEICKSNSIFVCSSSNNENSMVTLKNNIQDLYNYVIYTKEILTEDKYIDQLCKIELLISNLYYSFFSSPLNLPEKNSTFLSAKEYLTKSIELSKNLIEQINIPEQNRLAYLINLNLQNLLNQINVQP